MRNSTSSWPTYRPGAEPDRISVWQRGVAAPCWLPGISDLGRHRTDVPKARCAASPDSNARSGSHHPQSIGPAISRLQIFRIQHHPPYKP